MNDGSIFLDKDYKWEPPSSNLLIYGHNNKNGNMFQELLKYEEESYYKEHPVIKFTTATEDTTYGEQLMTLSTCEYSQENGRFAVIAKKVK